MNTLPSTPEGNLKAQAVEAAGCCVLSMSQQLGANGLLPVGASESPGVTERLITGTLAKVYKGQKAEEERNISPLHPNMCEHFSMRKTRASSVCRTIVNINK